MTNRELEGDMYSQNDLTVINKAISDLQAGRRVTSVSYGDTHVQYANMSLEELLKMRSLILSNLENSNSSKRQVRFMTSKGV